MNHRLLNVLAGTGIVACLAACGSPATSSSTPTAPSSSASQVSTSAAPAKALAKAEDACGKRPLASGDIYVRMIQPGQAPVAQELGGEWEWNAALGKCLTSVQMIIATAPRIAGTCTQVGYIADNPGYNPDADVAAPLKHVAAQVGPAC